MKQYGAKTITLAILLQLGITFVVAAACGLVCAVLMLPLGFQYDGLWAIVVFFFFGSVLSRPLSLVAEALPKALYAAKMLPLWGARLCYLFLDAAATALPLAAVDLVMDSVTAPWPALALAGLVLALPWVKDIGKEEKE